MRTKLLKRFLSIIIFGALLTSSFSLLHIGAKAYNTYENDLVLINTYALNVTVDVLGSSFEMEPFEIITVQTSVDDNLELEVFNTESGELIKTIRTEEVIKSNIISIIVLNDYNRDICYLVGDVEPFYYQHNKQPTIRYRYQSRNFVTKTEYRAYAHPGNALIDNFEAERRSKKILGFFPIDCQYVDIEEKISETVRLYQTYESGVQKKIYDLLKADIGTINKAELELNYYLNL